jgi:acyl-ACP thioesterase
MDFLQSKTKVSFTDVDPSGAMTPYAIFDSFQKIAVAHAEELTLGRLVLLSEGKVWMLSRIVVQTLRRPRLDDFIKITTWPRGCDKLFAVRDYTISSCQNHQTDNQCDDDVWVRSRSYWLLIDIEKRRPLRPQIFEHKLPLNEGRDALSICNSSIKERAGLVRKGERVAQYSDIDFNAHLNNARLVQWLSDYLGNTILEASERSTLSINYLSEVHANETIGFFTVVEESGSGFYFEGCKSSNGEPAFRAYWRFEQ